MLSYTIAVFICVLRWCILKMALEKFVSDVLNCMQEIRNTPNEKCGQKVNMSNCYVSNILQVTDLLHTN